MGIGEFEVRAEKTGSDFPQFQPKLESKEGDGPWRHFVCVVPANFGLDRPIQFNSLEMADFSRFRLTISLPDLKLPDGLSFGGGVEFSVDAGQVIHPERLSDQPFLASLRAGVEALGHCISRRLDQPGFLQALNAAALPVLWRNELADGVFMPSAKSPPQNTVSPSAAEDDIDALLASISDPSGKPLPTAADRFIAEVGETESTGFTLNETEARRFYTGLSGLLRDLETGIFTHASVEKSLGFVLALHPLLKVARGPRHIHFHILPAGMAPQSWPAYWSDSMANHRGRIESWIYMAGGKPENDGWIDAWESFFRKAGSMTLIQSEISPKEWLDWAKDKASAYVFSGGVVVALGDGRYFLKPAALAYYEALLRNQAVLPEASVKDFWLEDQDVSPGSRSSADKVYDGEAMRELRALGLNVPIGAKNRAGVEFLSLVRSSNSQ